jgi:hypothetical protein
MNFLDRFSKNTHIKFFENPANGSRVVPCGETDRHDEANSRSSQFCESFSMAKETTLYSVAFEPLVSQLGTFEVMPIKLIG